MEISDFEFRISNLMARGELSPVVRLGFPRLSTSKFFITPIVGIPPNRGQSGPTPRIALPRACKSEIRNPKSEIPQWRSAKVPRA
jgi:hypothetical protein